MLSRPLCSFEGAGTALDRDRSYVSSADVGLRARVSDEGRPFPPFALGCLQELAGLWRTLDFCWGVGQKFEPVFFRRLQLAYDA